MGAGVVCQTRRRLAAAEAKDPRRHGPTAGANGLTSGSVFDQWSEFDPRGVWRSSESFEGLEGGGRECVARQAWTG